jgi:putative transposase
VIWIDYTFAGKEFIAKIADQFGWTLEHLKRTSDEPEFTVTPNRWAVERTYAWFGNYRRLSKDYEFLSATSEMMLFASMVHLMVRRLSPKSILGEHLTLALSINTYNKNSAFQA